MLETRAYAATDPRSPLGPFSLHRREPGPHDVQIEIDWCGVCHSDLHQARNEWGGATYPMVPGHEIAGRVARVGAAVTKLRPGDLAGVGCFVDSCRACEPCRRSEEQYCERHTAFTYSSTEMDGVTVTQGGYSTRIVVDENYALRLSDALPLEVQAPLLCAGITTWSPLRKWKVGPGQRVGVVGLGGLGHMAVKLAASLGAEVTLLSGSPQKRADAHRLGAHEFILSSDARALAVRERTFDFVIDTVSADHPIEPFVKLLRTDGTLVLVGAPEKPLALPAMAILLRRRSVSGSLIGGIRETQEVLDHCAAHKIGADVEVIRIEQINEAYERLLKSDVRYRFVIDIGSLRG